MYIHVCPKWHARTHKYPLTRMCVCLIHCPQMAAHRQQREAHVHTHTAHSELLVLYMVVSMGGQWSPLSVYIQYKAVKNAFTSLSTQFSCRHVFQIPRLYAHNYCSSDLVNAHCTGTYAHVCKCTCTCRYTTVH